MLLAAQLSGDTKLRMGLFALLPLTLIYLFVAVSGVPAPGGAAAEVDFGAIALAVMFFAVFLRLMVIESEAWPAAWVFLVSPADPARMVQVANRALFGWILAPYLVCVGGILFWFTGTLHAAEVAIIGMHAYVMIQAVAIVRPDIAFSRPRSHALGSPAFFVLMVLGGVLSVIAAALGRWSGSGLVRVAAVLLVLTAVTVGLDCLQRGRARRAPA